MPYSDAQGKDIAAGWYREIRPRTAVDIGAGSGTYARAMRGTSQWQGRWTAVEAWAPYVDQFGLRDLYNDVVVGDARHLPAQLFAVDLVVAGDVLEHMPMVDAAALLDRIRTYAAHLIVSVPVLHLDQDAVYGNPYERHVDHWTADQMRAHLTTMGKVRAEFVGDVLAYFWWARD